MTAPPRISGETLQALESARTQNTKRHELRGCHSCTQLWPDGTCRLDGRRGKDGQFPTADGLGCGKWDPIYAPGKHGWASPITQADEAWFWAKQQEEDATHVSA